MEPPSSRLLGQCSDGGADFGPGFAQEYRLDLRELVNLN